MVLPISSSAALVRNSPVPLALYSIIKQQNPLLELHTEKLVQSKFLKMATSNVNPSGSSSGGNNHSKYLNKLRELKSRRMEGTKSNHQEVVAEDKRSKLPSNWEAKKARADWILSSEARRKDAADRGEDYDMTKLLEIGADEAERKDRKNRLKNPDKGFSGFEQATIRQYNRLVKDIKPDMEEYEKAKETLGEAFFPGRNTIVHGLHKDTPEAVNRMVEDLHKQIEKREKYSRRRRHDDDAEIDYINERNMRFNKKLDRFYGEYTTEIKQNLERGTAI